MLMLPVDLSQQFNESLTRKPFPDEAKSTYLKWLRFFIGIFAISTITILIARKACLGFF
jgi:hypothetical protein